MAQYLNILCYWFVLCRLHALLKPYDSVIISCFGSPECSTALCRHHRASRTACAPRKWRSVFCLMFFRLWNPSPLFAFSRTKNKPFVIVFGKAASPCGVGLGLGVSMSRSPLVCFQKDARFPAWQADHALSAPAVILGSSCSARLELNLKVLTRDMTLINYLNPGALGF